MTKKRNCLTHPSLELVSETSRLSRSDVYCEGCEILWGLRSECGKTLSLRGEMNGFFNFPFWRSIFLEYSINHDVNIYRAGYSLTDSERLTAVGSVTDGNGSQRNPEQMLHIIINVRHYP